MSRKPYVRPVSPTTWYFRHPRYLRYMSREVTCVFVGALALLLICLLDRLAAGPEAYAAFLAALRSPWSVLGLVLILGFAVHNATSWFNVTPKALPVQLGETFLPGKVIVAAHYAGWVFATVLVLLLAGAF